MRKILIPIFLMGMMACKKEMPEVKDGIRKEQWKDDLNEKQDTKDEENTTTKPNQGNTDLPSSEGKEDKPTDLAALEKFYTTKFVVNAEFIQQHYMQGVYENVSGFLGNILIFDETRYKPGTVVSKGEDQRRNSFTVTFKVYDVKDNTEYVEITKDFSGFKTVKTLVEGLKISPRHELLEIVRKALDKKNLSNDLAKALEGNFVNKKWMHLMDYTYQNSQLELQEIQKSYGKDQIIRGNGECLDVYLVNPRWKLISAKVKDQDLHFTVQLEMVNLTVLSDVTFQFVVKGVKSSDASNQ